MIIRMGSIECYMNAIECQHEYEFCALLVNVYESHGKDQGHVSQISVYLVSQIRPTPRDNDLF